MRMPRLACSVRQMRRMGPPPHWHRLSRMMPRHLRPKRGATTTAPPTMTALRPPQPRHGSNPCQRGCTPKRRGKRRTAPRSPPASSVSSAAASPPRTPPTSAFADCAPRRASRDGTSSGSSYLCIIGRPTSGAADTATCRWCCRRCWPCSRPVIRTLRRPAAVTAMVATGTPTLGCHRPPSLTFNCCWNFRGGTDSIPMGPGTTRARYGASRDGLAPSRWPRC